MEQLNTDVECLLSEKSKGRHVSGAAARYSKKQTFAAYEIRLPASGSYGRRLCKNAAKSAIEIIRPRISSYTSLRHAREGF